MTKRKTIDPKKRRGGRDDPTSAKTVGSNPESSWLAPSAMRETIESVIIAFVLAFLFRTFEAEAFVIPTGSMAPTLMGKHKDVECPMCHYRYHANASENREDNKPALVATTTCPMCRYTADVSPGNPQHKTYETYDGDRILVAKFPYDLADPKRWDVVVFKYPGDSTMNYIKRLVGLPGETIRIKSGDLWIHHPDDKEGDFEIARKPPPKILAMMQPVYDNDLAPVISGDLHWPARWTAEPSGDDFTWGEVKDLSSFGTKGKGTGEAWIRYRHRLPTNNQWRDAILATGAEVPDKADRKKWADLLASKMPPANQVRPQLIADFAAYNTSVAVGQLYQNMNGIHWVGDLAVQFELESTAAAGNVTAELIKGGRHFRCRFDLATGNADMTISGNEVEAVKFHPTAKTTVAGAGKHKIIFSNVDDELRLWVDGSVVAFDSDTAFDSEVLEDHIPTADDLSPVGIGAQGAAVEVRHIKILRDIYYIADTRDRERHYPLTDTNQQPPLTDFTYHFPNLADPENWPVVFSHGERGNMWTADIVLKPANPAEPAKDQFFVLGDNSAQSQDGRLWITDSHWHGGDRQHFVDRELFIGKALFIYWPHGWGIPYVPLPFNPVPNFGRMHLVR